MPRSLSTSSRAWASARPFSSPMRSSSPLQHTVTGAMTRWFGARVSLSSALMKSGTWPCGRGRLAPCSWGLWAVTGGRTANLVPPRSKNQPNLLPGHFETAGAALDWPKLCTWHMGLAAGWSHEPYGSFHTKNDGGGGVAVQEERRLAAIIARLCTFGLRNLGLHGTQSLQGCQPHPGSAKELGQHGLGLHGGQLHQEVHRQVLCLPRGRYLCGWWLNWMNYKKEKFLLIEFYLFCL